VRGKLIASNSPKKKEREKLKSFRETVTRMSAIQEEEQLTSKKHCFVERTLCHTESF